MPTSLSSLLILLFALLPGGLGESLYRLFVGYDWREDIWNRIFRIIGFSVGGLILYILIGSQLWGFPIPSYIFPGTYQNPVLDSSKLFEMAFSLGGHFVAATIVGISSGIIVRLLNQRISVTGYADSWDRFISDRVANHWVVVSLEGGEAYAGWIDRADTSVRLPERDIILAEPAQFEKKQKN